MFRSQGGSEVPGGHRWAARATLAEMRKKGASLPSEVAEEANPRTPSQGVRPPAGTDRGL
jgi:hypothetical protein